MSPGSAACFRGEIYHAPASSDVGQGHEHEQELVRHEQGEEQELHVQGQGLAQIHSGGQGRSAASCSHRSVPPSRLLLNPLRSDKFFTLALWRADSLPCV